MKRIVEIFLLSSFLAIFILTSTNYQVEHKIVVPAKIIDTETQPIKYVEIITLEEQQEEIRNEIYYGELEELALLVQAEAGNQDELGKRYVADCVLNRVEDPDFPDNIHDVIYQTNPTQFSPTTDGGIEKAGYTITEDVFQIVLEEVEQKTNTEVVYFRTQRYSSSGHPAFKHGDHYFSTR